MLNYKNPKKQGDVGLGMAIGWFAAQGYTVSLPLSDSQDYDLVVEIKGKLNKVQVRTSRYKYKSDNYIVHLRVCGGNRSRNTYNNFNNKSIDYLFAFLEDKRMFFIPSKDIKSVNSLTMCKKYDKYEVFF